MALVPDALMYLLSPMYDATTGEEIITDHNNPLNHTIDVTMIPGTEYGGSNWAAVEQHDGARCIKWEFAVDLTTAMENDYHIFRLADVYLMKAEALLRGAGGAGEYGHLGRRPIGTSPGIGMGVLIPSG